MKKLILSMLLILVAFESPAADVITLTGSSTYTLGSNDVAEIISISSISGEYRAQQFSLNGVGTPTMVLTTGGIFSLLPLVITGPSNTIATVAAVPGNFVTFRLRTKAEFVSSLAVPSVAVSSSVVIPEDTAGPVTLVMESSTDMVTWTAANPGTYGTSTPRRFFRIRALRN